MRAWYRQLQIILTSKTFKKKLFIGHLGSEDNLHIRVNGTKYLSSLKDSGIVQIDNLSMKEIMEMIAYEYTDIEIVAGYRDGSIFTLYKGGVLYISNKMGDRKTNTVYIFYASKLVAQYGQSRLNLTINSGINMYYGFQYLCRRAGINQVYISEEFKNKLFRQTFDVSNTIGSILDNIATASNYCVQSDASYNNILSIWDPARLDSRVIELNEKNVMLVNGYPTLTTNGVTFALLPTFNFMCGDIIKIDNAWLDMGLTSPTPTEYNRGYFLDSDGCYMIYQIDYSLDNRSSDFSFKLLCKSRSLVRRAGLTSYGGTK